MAPTQAAIIVSKAFGANIQETLHIFIRRRKKYHSRVGSRPVNTNSASPNLNLYQYLLE